MAALGSQDPRALGSALRAYSHGLFLDNDSTQIRLVRASLPRIETIQIPESETLRPQSLSEIQRQLESISGHSFITNRYIERVQRIRQKPYHAYDPVSGIQESHISQVDSWIQRTNGSPNRALLVDWDRTLSVFEGYIGDDEGGIIGNRIEYYEDLLTFLLGGAPRLAAIRGMLRRSYESGIDIYVVTNNTGCNDIPSGFNHFVKQLFQNIPYILVCGQEFGGHKGRALESYPQFARLRQPATGGRHKSRKYRCRRRRTIRNSR
jgi:hypothetical protein